MIRYLEAPNYENIRDDESVVFLAGPITGAPNWQPEVTNLLKQYSESNYVIANPRRQETTSGYFNDYEFSEQVDWEIKHLQYADQKGAILFWFPKEEFSVPTRDYAQTSRFELGYFVRNNPYIFIGIESGFPGERYIKYMLPKYRDFLPIIVDNLDELCRKTAYFMDATFK